MEVRLVATKITSQYPLPFFANAPFKNYLKLFKTVTLYLKAIWLFLKVLRFRYRVSQKTWEFSDELDIVFVMN